MATKLPVWHRLITLDEEDARRVVRELLDDGVESFAVSLHWSFLNPVHEQRLAQIISEEAPDAFVSLSHELLPRMGELARTTAQRSRWPWMRCNHG